MTPAEVVIKEFGGIRELARALEIHPSSVWQWKQPRNSGRGRDGLIPSDFHETILNLAKLRQVTVTPTDLVLGRP